MKNNQPLVSVIMNCYNSDTYLREAIDSVITQSYQNWEIIFWDNQSTDTSANIIASYNDQRIKYFYAPEHTILGEARNLALTQVSGQLIAFLDCDDLWEEQKLELQVQTFIHDQNIALVYTNYWSFNQTKMQKTKALKGNTIEGYGDVTFKKLLLKYPIGMSTVMISFNKLQLLNEWFDPHLRLTEEFDLFLRISYNGKIKYINAPLMTYRVHGDNQTIKLLDSWKNEYIYLIEKFSNIFLNFSKIHHKEIKYLLGQGNYIAGKYYFQQGKYNEAKAEFYAIRNRSLKSMFYYLFSLFKSIPKYHN